MKMAPKKFRLRLELPVFKSTFFQFPFPLEILRRFMETFADKCGPNSYEVSPQTFTKLNFLGKVNEFVDEIKPYYYRRYDKLFFNRPLTFNRLRILLNHMTFATGGRMTREPFYLKTRQKMRNIYHIE